MPSLTVYLRQLCLSACAIIDCLLALSLTVYPRQLCLSARTIIEYLLPLSLTACPQRHCLPAYSRCRCLPVGPRRYFLHARDVTSCMPAALLPACPQRHFLHTHGVAACLPATSLPACPRRRCLPACPRRHFLPARPRRYCLPGCAPKAMIVIPLKPASRKRCSTAYIYCKILKVAIYS
jgi:hypothetical protein